MSETGNGADGNEVDDELTARLADIEGTPLAERAEAYARIDDDLRRRLEGEDDGPSEAGSAVPDPANGAAHSSDA